MTLPIARDPIYRCRRFEAEIILNCNAVTTRQPSLAPIVSPAPYGHLEIRTTRAESAALPLKRETAAPLCSPRTERATATLANLPQPPECRR
jgi:hypothetical protein